MPYAPRVIPKHTQVYFEALGYDKEDETLFVPSELSNKKAIDIHHIVNRSNMIFQQVLNRGT